MNDDSLINLVQEHPLLYDKNVWDFKNSAKKKDTWKLIGNKLGITGEFCFRRWSALRDRYGRELRQSKNASESGVMVEPTWQHFEHLDFLRTHMQPKKQRSSFQYKRKADTDDDSVDVPRKLKAQADDDPVDFPRKKKAQAECDSVSFQPVLDSLQTSLMAPKETVKDPQAHSYGKFVEHCLEVMGPNKKLRTIVAISKILAAAQIDPNIE